MAWLIAFLTWAAPCLGQTELDASDWTFTAMLWKDLPIDKLYYKEGAEYLPISLNTRKRSKEYPLADRQTFELFTPAVDENGQEFFRVVASQALTDVSRKMFFLIVPVPKPSGLPLAVIALDDTLNNFPPGSFRFFNFTKSRLLIKVKENFKPVASGQSVLIPTEGAADGGLIPVAIGGNDGDLLHFTRMTAHPRSRKMIFIAQSENPKRKFKFRFVPQNIPSWEMPVTAQ